MDEEWSDQRAVACHNEAATAADSYDEYLALLREAVADVEDVTATDVRRAASRADASVEPVPEASARPPGERDDTGADQTAEPVAEFDVVGGRCWTDGADIVVEQSLRRYVRRPVLWLLPATLGPSGAALLLTGTTYTTASGVTYTGEIVLLLGLFYPAVRAAELLAARRRGYTGTDRIPQRAVTSVRLAVETRRRRGERVRVPVFEVRYRDDGARRRRRLRVPRDARRWATVHGVRFFRGLDLDPNPDGFPVDEGVCAVEDGALTFTAVGDRFMSRRTGALVTVVGAAGLLAALFAPVDLWRSLPPTLGGGPASDPVGRTVVLVVSVVALFWGGSALATPPPFERSTVPLSDVESATVRDPPGDAPSLELALDDGAMTVPLPSPETVGDLPVATRARAVLADHGLDGDGT